MSSFFILSESSLCLIFCFFYLLFTSLSLHYLSTDDGYRYFASYTNYCYFLSLLTLVTAAMTKSNGIFYSFSHLNFFLKSFKARELNFLEWISDCLVFYFLIGFRLCLSFFSWLFSLEVWLHSSWNSNLRYNESYFTVWFIFVPV